MAPPKQPAPAAKTFQYMVLIDVNADDPPVLVTASTATDAEKEAVRRLFSGEAIIEQIGGNRKFTVDIKDIYVIDSDGVGQDAYKLSKAEGGFKSNN